MDDFLIELSFDALGLIVEMVSLRFYSVWTDTSSKSCFMVCDPFAVYLSSKLDFLGFCEMTVT